MASQDKLTAGSKPFSPVDFNQCMSISVQHHSQLAFCLESLKVLCLDLYYFYSTSMISVRASQTHRQTQTRDEINKLQQDLTTLAECRAKLWDMSFNVKKCANMCISLKWHPIQHEFDIHGQRVPDAYNYNNFKRPWLEDPCTEGTKPRLRGLLGLSV